MKAWAHSLKGINFPLLSDFWPHGAVAEEYGVLRSEGYTERALFIVDDEGVIRYIDIHDFDEQPNNEELLAQLRIIDPEAALHEPTSSNASQLPYGGIVVYCTKWCPDCRNARQWLQERGLPYTEVDLYATPGALEQVRLWGNGKLITPTFDIDGEIVLDFDPGAIEQIVGIQGG